MKALKTIVATAVIVFALTTVAMAGARHFTSRGNAATVAAGPAAPQTHQVAGVTLTDDQFARLLRVVGSQGATPHTTHADREMRRARTRDHSRHKASDAANHTQTQHRAQSHQASGATHSSDATHDDGTHDSGGTHDGGTHDGGCTHDGGTHDGGCTHDEGGTHDD
jgi:hypothetical protein